MKYFVNHAVLVWGKVRRMWFIYLNPGKTKVMLSRREGECARCGACCKINFDCPALVNHGEAPSCWLYDRRSNVCRYFPIDERDIKDRNRIMPHIQCGYKFNGHNGGNGELHA
jgi:hypothetical protein